MKKFIAIIALVSMLGCVSCTGKENSEQTPASNATEAAADSATDAATEAEATEAETADSAIKEEDFFNWNGLKMYRPSEYLSDTSEGFPFYQLIDDDLKKLRNLSYYTYYSKSVDSMTSESAMQTIYEDGYIRDITRNVLKGSTIDSNDIESEETVQVNGCDLIRQAGVYHLDDISEQKDVAYVAYFGVMDFPEEGKQPAVWIAMSEDLSDESKAELARLVDTAAENAVPFTE